VQRAFTIDNERIKAFDDETASLQRRLFKPRSTLLGKDALNGSLCVHRERNNEMSTGLLAPLQQWLTIGKLVE